MFSSQKQKKTKKQKDAYCNKFVKFVGVSVSVVRNSWGLEKKSGLWHTVPVSYHLICYKIVFLKYYLLDMKRRRSMDDGVKLAFFPLGQSVEVSLKYCKIL